MGFIDLLGKIGEKGIFGAMKSFSGESAVGWGSVEAFKRVLGGNKNKAAGEYYEGWVSSCVDVISADVASIQLVLNRRKANGEVEVLEDHPALDLLNDPNPVMTKYTLLFRLQANQELQGEEYWFISPDKAGNPSMIFPLIGGNVKPLPDADGRYIKGYEYHLGGKKFTFPAETICSFRTFHPKSDIRGLSTIAKARVAADTDEYAREYNRSFFEESAVPGIVLKYPGNIDQTQIDKMKSQWNQEFKGFKKNNRVAVASNGLEIHKLEMSHNDMQYLEGRGFTRDEIYAIFRVPKEVAGMLSNSNFASAKAADYVFAKRTVKPKMTLLVDALNKYFLPMFKEEGLFFTFKNPVPKDVATQIQYYGAGIQQGWLTHNEIRRMEGLSELENGDETFIAFNMTPYSRVKSVREGISVKVVDKGMESLAAKVVKALPEKYTKCNHDHEPKKELTLEAQTTSMDGEIFELMGERKYQMAIKRAVSFEEKFSKAAQGLFDDQKKRAIDALKKELNRKDWKASKFTLLDEAAEVAVTIDLFTPLFKALVAEEGQSALDFLNLDDDFDASTPDVKKFIEANTKKFAGSVTETTTAEIRTLISAGVEAGEAIDQLTERIVNYSGFKKARAEMIARSEVVRGSTNAELFAWKNTGVVDSKAWYTAQDKRVCPTCGPLHGKEVGLDSSFLTLKEMSALNIANYDGSIKGPPVHPMCRCTLIPVLNGKSYSPKKYEPSKDELVDYYLANHE